MTMKTAAAMTAAAPAAAPMPMPAFAPSERLSLDAADPPALSLVADGVAVADEVLEWLVGIGTSTPFGAPAEVDAAVVCALLDVGTRLELVTKLELGVAGETRLEVLGVAGRGTGGTVVEVTGAAPGGVSPGDVGTLVDETGGAVLEGSPNVAVAHRALAACVTVEAISAPQPAMAQSRMAKPKLEIPQRQLSSPEGQPRVALSPLTWLTHVWPQAGRLSIVWVLTRVVAARSSKKDDLTADMVRDVLEGYGMRTLYAAKYMVRE